MKKLIFVLCLILLVGCGSGGGSTKSKDFTTSDGYEVGKAQLMTIAEKTIEKYERQSVSVDTDITISKDSPVEIDGEAISDVYAASGDYKFEGEVYSYYIKVAFKGKDGNYMVVRYRNDDTGKDLEP